MSAPNDNDVATNFGYASADETASLLHISSSSSNPKIVAATTSGSCAGPSSGHHHQATAAKLSNNGPTLSNAKPTLIRQDRTSTYLTSPSLSQTVGYSEESGQSNEDSEPLNTTTELDIQYNRLETPVISISNVCQAGNSNVGHFGGGGSSFGSNGSFVIATSGTNTGGHRGSISGYQISPSTSNRCRSCRSCDRRASTTPVSSLHIMRSVSKESMRSNTVYGYLSPSCASTTQQHHQRMPPPVLLTDSPSSGGGSRIIRQSSQPEASNIVCCGGHNTCNHSQTAPSMSMKLLREPSEGIAGIAVDSLKINGAMKPFKQVIYAQLHYHPRYKGTVFVLVLFFCLL